MARRARTIRFLRRPARPLLNWPSMREADLFSPLRRHFEAQGYAVYAEVPGPHGGYVDLLAVRDQVTVAVEMKLRFSREAVRQAGRNKRFVWQSWVAVPGSALLPPRRRGALKRNAAGLLLVCGSEVKCAAEAPVQAPSYSVRQAFGPLLEGELGALFASARGGVPSAERLSLFRTFAEKLRAALETRGGLANTDQLLEDTLAWNYFRGQRAGLVWLLENRFTKIDEDLWASGPRRRTALRYALPLDSLVKTHLPGTFVCVPPPACLPQPGDIVELKSGEKVERRARVIAASRHPVVETPQRELRAGPAVFFRHRCPAGVPLPPETLVLRLGSGVATRA